MTFDYQRGQATVNHDVDKHRCPICNHVCYVAKPQATGRSRGRPPVQRYRLLDILREQASPEKPLPLPELSRQMGMQPSAVQMIVQRVRHAGYDVRRVPGRGYYIAPDDEIAQQYAALDSSP